MQFETASLKDWFAGCDCFLACPGPSLAEAAATLNTPPRLGWFLMAINTAYPAIGRPDAWVGGDPAECYDAGLPFEPFLKFFCAKFAETTALGRALKTLPGVVFLSARRDGRQDFPGNAFLPARLGPQPDFVWSCWTIFRALHVAAWLGARRINLVGADLRPKAGYHDGRHLESWLAERNERAMAAQVQWMRQAAEKGAKFGFELRSCSANSALNEFLPFVPLSDALAQARQNAPAVPADYRRLHAYVANLSAWPAEKRLRGERGILTGADRRTEWQLAWWLRNVRRFAGDLSVAVADFGLTERTRRRLAATGCVLVDCRDTELAGWLNKPIALVRSPWRRTLWLDTDAELRASLPADLWDSPGELVAAADGHNDMDGVADAVNTGVLLSTHGNRIVQAWARLILSDPRRWRGDQEALNRGLGDELFGGIDRLDKRLNWLRLDGPAPADAIIVHWTGPAGKQEIRRQLVRDPAKLPAAADATGWRGDEILARLRIDRPCRGAEIGVLAGRLSAFLLRHAPRLHLVMVDRWAEPPADSSYATSGDGLVGRPAERWELDRQRAMAETAFASDRRTVLRGDSVEMAGQVADGSLDFVFLDGDHSEAGVLADLRAWAPKVRPGGWIGGHDIDNPAGPRWGARSAIEKSCDETGIAGRVELGRDFTWFMQMSVLTAARDGSRHVVVPT